MSTCYIYDLEYDEDSLVENTIIQSTNSEYIYEELWRAEIIINRLKFMLNKSERTSRKINSRFCRVMCENRKPCRRLCGSSGKCWQHK